MSANTSAQKDNVISSGLAGLERFSSAKVQDRLFRESIDKALKDLRAAAERGSRADILKIEQLARNAKDPALQEALRKSFADLQKQIGNSLADAQGRLDSKKALKAMLDKLGNLAKAGGWVFSAYQVDQAVDSGDPRQIGKTLTDMLTGALMAELGAYAAGTLLGTALAPVIGAALGTWIAAHFLSGLFPEFEKWLGELTQEWRNALADWFEKTFSEPKRDEMDNRFSSATSSNTQRVRPPVDPLVLDLDGDGIASVPLGQDEGVRFDHSGNGVATRGGWIGPDDGFLVVDRNGNGVIDDGSELFGESSILENGLQPTDGFAALEAYDSNGDGIVDANDKRFGELKVWRDRNQDGISQPDELTSLEEAGVAALETSRKRVDVDLGDGNSILFQGRYIGTDGYARDMADVLLAQDTYRSEFRDGLAVPEEYYALPDAEGSGRVRNLREAATLSAALKAAVENYRSQTSVSGQKALLDDLLRKWAATSGYDPETVRFLDKTYHLSYIYAPVSGFSDAELAAMQSVLERFTGHPLFDIYAWIRNPLRFPNVTKTDSGADVDLVIDVGTVSIAQMVSAYEALADGVFETLFIQTLGAPMMDALVLSYRNGGLDFDFSGMESQISDMVDRDREEGFRVLFELIESKGAFLQDQGWDSVAFIGKLIRKHGLPSFANGHGYDFFDESGVFHGALGNHVLFGSSQPDMLVPDKDIRVFVGGPGDDVLDGGPGEDIYVFNIGDGSDRLFVRDSRDRLRFGSDISRESISLRAEGDEVVIRYGDSDQIILDAFYLDEGSGESITLEFTDGTSMILSLSVPFDASGVHVTEVDVLGSEHGDQILTTYPADRLNRLIGGGGDDLIVSGAAGDLLEGGDGNDTLIGGPGNDSLRGGSGSDTYVFGFGDGHDWIVEEEVVRGGRLSSNDVAKGIGRYPETEMGNNVIRFTSGVSPEDVTVTIDSQVLILGLTGGRDSLSIPFHDWNAIGRVLFEDDPDIVWEQEDIFRMARMNAYPGGVAYGGLGDDVIVGTDGDDTIDATYGYDVIKGMGGRDTLYASAGFTHIGGGADDDVVRGIGIGGRFAGHNNGASAMVVDPGAGDDRIVPNALSTHVLFGPGSDHDVIDEHFRARELYIVLADGIRPTDVLVESSLADANRYSLTLAGTGDRLEFPGRLLREVQFRDGTVWTLDDLVALDPYSEANRSAGVTITGGASGEASRGFGGNDVLYGSQGDDDIRGFEGDDRLVGGGGDDWLRGGPGADTYFFEAGDGSDYIVEDRRLSLYEGATHPDVIEFGSAVMPDDIEVLFQNGGFHNRNLLLANITTGDSVTVSNWFESDIMDGTLEVRFADGTVWTTGDLRTLASVDSATNGNDFLVGTQGADEMDGRTGDDVIRTLAGNDRISGGPGDDHLEGGTGDDIYF